VWEKENIDFLVHDWYMDYGKRELLFWGIVFPEWEGMGLHPRVDIGKPY